MFFFFFFLSLSGSKNPTPNQQTTKRKRNQDITTKAINGGLRKTNTHGDEWQEITNGGGLAAVELHSVFQHRTGQENDKTHGHDKEHERKRENMWQTCLVCVFFLVRSM